MGCLTQLLVELELQNEAHKVPAGEKNDTVNQRCCQIDFDGVWGSILYWCVFEILIFPQWPLFLVFFLRNDYPSSIIILLYMDLRKRSEMVWKRIPPDVWGVSWNVIFGSSVHVLLCAFGGWTYTLVFCPWKVNKGRQIDSVFWNSAFYIMKLILDINNFPHVKYFCATHLRCHQSALYRSGGVRPLNTLHLHWSMR